MSRNSIHHVQYAELASFKQIEGLVCYLWISFNSWKGWFEEGQIHEY
jgi:hypothetical protein